MVMDNIFGVIILNMKDNGKMIGYRDMGFYIMMMGKVTVEHL